VLISRIHFLFPLVIQSAEPSSCWCVYFHISIQYYDMLFCRSDRETKVSIDSVIGS
jgi:hypothetical protein